MISIFDMEGPWIYPGWSVNRAIARTIQGIFENSHAMNNLLDVGCGKMPYRAIYESKVKTYIGIDVEHGKPHKNRVVGDTFNLPFGHNSLDAVASTQVIEHVDNPWVMVEELARVLKPGGLLVLSVPKMARTHGAPYDYFRFTEYGIEHMLKLAGLELEAIHPQGGIWLAIGYLLSFYISESWTSSKGLAGKIRRILMPALIRSCNAIGEWDDSRGGLLSHACNFVITARKPI